MSKMICFDMDGTIADLYGYTGWLDCLHNEDVAPFINATPMVDMDRLYHLLNGLIASGWEIRIISWLPKDASEAYQEAVCKAKFWWLDHYLLPLDYIHLVAYGTTKADCVRHAGEGAKILVDDDAIVRNGWDLGKAIDAAREDWLNELEALI